MMLKVEVHTTSAGWSYQGKVRPPTRAKYEDDVDDRIGGGGGGGFGDVSFSTLPSPAEGRKRFASSWRQRVQRDSDESDDDELCFIRKVLVSHSEALHVQNQSNGSEGKKLGGHASKMIANCMGRTSSGEASRKPCAALGAISKPTHLAIGDPAVIQNLQVQRQEGDTHSK
eukprot:1158788-Pelagomonas_calceolata.AAC.2